MAPTVYQGYSRAAAITLSDSVNIPQQPGNPYAADGLTDAIYVGTKGATGTIVAILQNHVAVTFVGLPAGTILPIRAIRVNNTGTDASDLVALYQV